LTIPAEVSDGTGRGSPDLHRRAESGADGPCSKSDGRRPAWLNGPRLFWPAWRANGTTRLAASLACGRIRWVCGASALRQLGWPDCGIGLGRARPPNMARICALRVLRQLELPPPKGLASWDGASLAAALGASDDAVWRLLRREGGQLRRRRSWCVSTDPQFATNLRPPIL
jgi:hypothetical protein